MSEHKNIAKALAAAQAEMGNAMKDSNNPHFKSKYADLASVRLAALPALNKNGISVFQPFVQGDLGHSVQTVLLHESGERLECSIPLLLGKQDMQGLGAAITYARRYGLMTMAGIAPDEGDDDDGEKNRNANPMGAALQDTWVQGVLDGLPENATPRQKAEGFSAAIIEGFKSKSGEKALENEWNRRRKMIGEFETRFPDLHGEIVDEYSRHMMTITDTFTSKEPVG